VTSSKVMARYRVILCVNRFRFVIKSTPIL